MANEEMPHLDGWGGLGSRCPNTPPMSFRVTPVRLETPPTPDPRLDGWGGLGNPLAPIDLAFDKPNVMPRKADGFEFADGTRQESGTFQKSKPFKKGEYRFKRGDHIRVNGRKLEVLHVEPFPDGKSYVHARSIAGLLVQDFFPNSEIHAA